MTAKVVASRPSQFVHKAMLGAHGGDNRLIRRCKKFLSGSAKILRWGNIDGEFTANTIGLAAPAIHAAASFTKERATRNDFIPMLRNRLTYDVIPAVWHNSAARPIQCPE